MAGFSIFGVRASKWVQTLQKFECFCVQSFQNSPPSHITWAGFLTKENLDHHSHVAVSSLHASTVDGHELCTAESGLGAGADVLRAVLLLLTSSHEITAEISRACYAG